MRQCFCDIRPGGTPSVLKTFTYNHAAENVTASGQVSVDLGTWSPAVIYRTVYHGDGAATIALRSPTPIPTNLRQFIRANFE